VSLLGEANPLGVDGTMTLGKAQRQIRTNWLKAYRRGFG
jgi:hypothetical protein